MHKHYYKCTLYLQSPLALSNGENENTDSDVLLGSDGRPFIPATSLAGVLRSLAAQEGTTLGGAPLQEALFGNISPNGSHVKSPVTVYDARLAPNAAWRKYQRDGVALTDHKNVIDGAKYDFEIVESKAPFTCYLETDADHAPALEALLCKAMASGLRLGGKTTRGYGQMKLSVTCRSFDFALPATPSGKDGFDAWLAFDLFAADAFARCPALQKDEHTHAFLQATFTLQGALAVREYASSKDASGADFAPMRNLAGNPVIPGTSWAGVFRHRMLRLAEEAGVADAYKAEADTLFGNAGKDIAHISRSRIVFSESEITQSTAHTRTRTALDRITGAAAESKLFTEGFCHGGETVLTIALPSGKISPLAQQLLAAALLDLHSGLTSVGGAGSIGHGLLQLSALQANGQDVLARLQAYDLTIFEQGGM